MHWCIQLMLAIAETTWNTIWVHIQLVNLIQKEGTDVLPVWQRRGTRSLLLVWAVDFVWPGGLCVLLPCPDGSLDPFPPPIPFYLEPWVLIFAWALWSEVTVRFYAATHASHDPGLQLRFCFSELLRLLELKGCFSLVSGTLVNKHYSTSLLPVQHVILPYTQEALLVFFYLFVFLNWNY